MTPRESSEHRKAKAKDAAAWPPGREEVLLQDLWAGKHHQVVQGLEQEAHEEVGPEGFVEHLEQGGVPLLLGGFDNQSLRLLIHVHLGASFWLGRVLGGVHDLGPMPGTQGAWSHRGVKTEPTSLGWGEGPTLQGGPVKETQSLQRWLSTVVYQRDWRSWLPHWPACDFRQVP